MGEKNISVHPEVKKDIPASGCDILLVPPVINPFFSVDIQKFMPLGLLALAASLRQEGLSPKIYKPHKRLISGADYRSVATDILKSRPAIIGFSTWCITYPASLLVARQIKMLQPGIPLVFGGPQASLLDQETLSEFSFVDYILAGEADFSLPLLVKSLLNGKSPKDLLKVPGLAFRIDDSIHRNKQPGFVAVLDDLPIPAYDLVKGAEALKIDAGRGCPFHCTYCITNTFFAKKYRTKSPDRIMAEMNHACETEGITRFSFAHDLFTLNKRFVLDLCRKLVMQQRNGGPKFTWTCSARVDTVTGEMLRAMKRAGCQAIFFGIESGSDKMQRLIQKNLNLADAYRIADLCRQLGLTMHASFIAGFPDETEPDIELTLQSVMQLAARGACVQISELSVLPGTSIFKNHHQDLSFDGRFSNFSDCICSGEEIQLIRQFPHIFSSFYYLPVESIQRDELHLMSHFINCLGEFRNTLTLLGNFILADLEKVNLLERFRLILPRFRQHLVSGLPPLSFLVRLMGEYLAGCGENLLPPATGDAFYFESSRSMLISAYLRSRLLDPTGRWIPGLYNQAFQGNTPQTLYPARVISTNCNLKWLLNGGKEVYSTRSDVVRRKFSYLLIALSEKRCIHFKISKKELNALMSGTPSAGKDLQGGLTFITLESLPPSLFRKFDRQKIVIPV